MPKRRRYGSRPGSSKRSRASYRKRRSGRRRYRRSRARKSTIGGFVHGVSDRRGPNVVNIRSIGMPGSLVIHLPYREFFKVDNGPSPYTNAGNYVFRLNSLYDPNLTGVGKQPRYYDQLVTSQLYRNYVVYKADVTVTMRHQGTNNDVMVGVAVRSTTTSPFTTQDLMYYNAELPYTATRQLNALGDDHARTTFKFSIHMARYFGVKKEKIYSDDIFHGAYNTNPAAAPYLFCAVHNDPADTAASASVECEVSILFHAKLWNLADDIPQS